MSSERIEFGVLGPVTAWDGTGDAIALKGPLHRAVLARLLVARRRVVPVGDLVDDLWVAPPAGAVAAVRTFVAALRRALEPGRPRRTPATVLVTDGPGYGHRQASAGYPRRRRPSRPTTPGDTMEVSPSVGTHERSVGGAPYSTAIPTSPVS
jgi:hypothetical protein